MAHLKSTFALLVATTVLLLLVCALHIWRFVRTRAGYHLLLTAAAFISALPLAAGLIASGRVRRIDLYGIAVDFAGVVAHLLLLLAPTAVLAGWGRTMRNTLGPLGRATFITGLTWMVLFALASVLHMARLGIMTAVGLTDSDEEDKPIGGGGLKHTRGLFAAGSILQLLGLAVLFVYSLALGVVMLLRHREQVALPQRRQLFVLAGAFLLLFAMLMCAYFGVMIGYLITMLLAYLVLLYPCHVAVSK